VQRLILLVATALVLAATGHLDAQEGKDFTGRGYFFTIKFPSQPQVTDTTYKSEYEADLPARVYVATQGSSRYSVTVANYNLSEPILSEKSKECPAGADPCGEIARALNGLGYWKNDVRGAITHAAWAVLKRPNTKITNYKWNYLYRTEGQEFQFTNGDGSQGYVGIYMYGNRLYIIEATLPAGSPRPNAFFESMVFLNRAGRPAFHEGLYINGALIDPNEGR
jgi:hypothetical protein